MWNHAHRTHIHCTVGLMLHIKRERQCTGIVQHFPLIICKLIIFKLNITSPPKLGYHVKVVITVEPSLTVIHLQQAPIYNENLSTMVIFSAMGAHSPWTHYSLWSQPLCNGHLSTVATATEVCPNSQNNLSTTAS